jgi:hypothetical protein
MQSLYRRLAGPAAAFSLLFAASAFPAAADEAAGKLAVTHLEAGTLADGEAALAAIVAKDTGNADATIGLGTIRFVRAMETLSQGLYKYGLKAPQSFLVPVIRLPVPENPNPQPITYQDFHDLLATFVRDLAVAEATLGAVKTDVKFVLDLKRVRYDANGDGTIGNDERLVAVLERVAGFPEEAMPASLTFAFDRGDAIWLQGYCNVLMAFGEFVLAHDWHESFDNSFFHFFPAMKSPFRDALAVPTQENYFLNEGGPIADFISFFHIRWQVSEPERMKASLARMKKVIALSRESWVAIEAETDNDREWLPNANQTSPFASMGVNAERIAAWRAVLDEADLILDGKKLVPHWRFAKGFNFRKIFEEPRPFDMVLWITGPAALPYLENGPVTTSANWDAMTRAFEGSFGVFAIWAN